METIIDTKFKPTRQYSGICRNKKCGFTASMSIPLISREYNSNHVGHDFSIRATALEYHPATKMKKCPVGHSISWNECGNDPDDEPTEWIGIHETRRVYGSETIIAESPNLWIVSARIKNIGDWKL